MEIVNKKRRRGVRNSGELDGGQVERAVKNTLWFPESSTAFHLALK